MKDGLERTWYLVGWRLRLGMGGGKVVGEVSEYHRDYGSGHTPAEPQEWRGEVRDLVGDVERLIAYESPDEC